MNKKIVGILAAMLLIAGLPAIEASADPAPVGDLPADSQGPNGWHQIFTDDFRTSGPATASGALPDGKWWGYQAGTPILHSTNGVYDSARTVSVSDGMLKFHLHSENGTAYAGVESPKGLAPQVYGRYDVRYRYETGSNIAGFKSVWMLWPNSDQWGEGETDFNEYGNGANRTHVSAAIFNACGNNSGCPVQTGALVTDPTVWHIATAIWSPGLVTAWIDGKLIAKNTSQVPTTPMRLLLQTEASDYGPQALPGAVMNIDVDYVTIYTRK